MKRLLPIKENQTSLVNDIVLFLCMGRYRFWVHWNHCFDKHPLVAQMVKHLSAVQKVWVWSLGWEDPLEEEMATHSSIPAWRIPWTEEPGGLQSMGLQRVRHNWATNTTTTNYLGTVSCFFTPWIPSGCTEATSLMAATCFVYWQDSQHFSSTLHSGQLE